MRDIILVGNGTSILDEKRGGLIDSYNKVVRFNSFKIKGFEDYTGTKTDVWFTVNRFHIKHIHDFAEVIVHSWASNQNCKLYKEYKDIRSVTKISDTLIKEIDMKTPSTGLIAIHYFLGVFDEVDIIGFDWWSREQHHYGDSEIRGTLHDPFGELKIINQLGDKVNIL